MPFRLLRVFRRYADENLRLEAPPREAAVFGRIDRLRLERNRLVVEGWTAAERIGIRLHRATLWTTPELAAPGAPLRGFALSIPFEPGDPEILTRTGGHEAAVRIAGFSAHRVRLARARLWLPYLWTLAGLLPQIRRWKLGGDPGAREIIKERLGLVPRSDAVEMSAAVLEPPSAPVPLPFSAVSLVIPVYEAFELLPEVLDRAETHADLPLRLILVEDRSPDPRVRPFLSDWAGAPGRRFPVRLILNDANLGFIASVNRGLAEARRWPDDPVVLLNSDALLPAGWTRRLLAPLADPTVASATPMSNDAEIFNVPVICRRGDLAPGEADRLDRAARGLNPAAGLAEAPTGVGFCMAMAPAFLARVPDLDTAFGRGYGEETDWCQKTRASGGRHVGVANLFVEHRGGSSFGSEAKQRLLERNGAEISRRYPGYDREVQTFIRDDPMATARLALGLSWAAERQDGPVPVWLAHAMGGGAENDLRRRIAAELAGGGSAVVLRVGQGHDWQLELHTVPGVTRGLSNDPALIRALVGRLPRRRIVYSCGVGARDPLTLPGLLLDLAGRGDDPLPGGPQPLEVLAHDFFPVSPSYTLLDRDGRYRGVPRPGTAAGDDPAHRAERPGRPPADLAQWQAAWGRLMAGAGRITAFSDSSRAILAEVWPGVAGRIGVLPHRLLHPVPRIAPARAADGRPAIGVLGNIGLQKGAAAVQRLSRDLARDPRLGLVVIGQFDPAYRLAPPARIHGSYEWQDLPGLVSRYGISAWLIPSIWPETFSFTTHEALATGLPVFAFDLGAQGDALRAALAAGAPGALLPAGPDPAIRPEDLLRHLPPAG